MAGQDKSRPKDGSQQKQQQRDMGGEQRRPSETQQGGQSGQSGQPGQPGGVNPQRK